MSIYNSSSLEYYVYAYLREDGSPYYIGKDKSNRLNSKQRTSSLPKNKSNIIIIQDKLTEKSALFLEQVYISFYGRKDNETGILRNLTDGGEGTSGRIVSEETKIKLRKPKKDTKNYRGTYIETHIKNCAEANRKKAKDPKFIEKLRKPKSAKTRENMKGEKSQKHIENMRKSKIGIKIPINSIHSKNAIQRGTHNFQYKNANSIVDICPFCKKSGSRPGMKRWHFEKCKEKV